MKYITFEVQDPVGHCREVRAVSWPEAVKICKIRQLGERVVRFVVYSATRGGA